MKINTSSWHYRYVNWWMTRKPGDRHHPLIHDHYYADETDAMPRSLCGYFWLAVFCMTILPFAVGVTMLFVYFGLAIWLLLLRPLYVYVLRPPARAIRDHHRQKQGKPKKERPHEPSLAWEFVKAKKRKVCPIITYEGNKAKHA